MKRIELLAPARDLECGLAAVNCGADAVYIGANAFGARENAGNSLDDIAALIRHARRYRARVYAAINTLLTDDELPCAVELICALHDCGIDGIIIQDLGLLECDLPPVPVIASTQMHNNTPEKAAFLEKIGFQRVILARELDIGQIREIRAHTSIELETFVHGALCVCYSGQCYLSYALGGRSGNRGRCAQPCRKRYTLEDSRRRVLKKDRYLLSLKDLNLSGRLHELIDAGITSFKIEGRLKDKTYVANVVSFYRQKLDGVLAERGLKKSSSGTSRIDFTPDLSKTFNRGYTTYFLHGRSESVWSPDTPKAVGEPIGRVTNISPRGVAIDTSVELHPGDGLCFFDRHGHLTGTVVNQVKSRVIVPEKPGGIEAGTFIHRNHDHEFLNRVRKSRMDRTISVSMVLRPQSGGFELTVTDEDGVQATARLEGPFSPAEKPEQAVAGIRRQLAKTGDTCFTCGHMDIDLPDPVFLPAASVNALRRKALETLEEKRGNWQPWRPGHGISPSNEPYPVAELSFTGNVLNRKAREFYLRHGVRHIEPAAESGLNLKGRAVMTTRHCIRHELGLCLKNSAEKKDAAPLCLIDESGRRFDLHFDCKTCQMSVRLPAG